MKQRQQLLKKEYDPRTLLFDTCSRNLSVILWDDLLEMVRNPISSVLTEQLLRVIREIIRQ